MTEVVLVSNGCRGEGGGGGEKRVKGEEQHQQQQQQQQLSLLAFLLAAIRKSMVACRVERREDVISAVQQHMEIGRPTDVRHITHVTFDRFNGFLGLPVEFEVEIPGKVPSASANVFGVSPESMQCCYDSKGNSVPTILLLMQERLYSQGGLKAEGIFRINPENGQEEEVRDQLNKGIVPDNIDVHCLAGLIKAWFRELPSGVLDSLSPERVLQSNTEEECVELVKRLLPTQAALLNWAVELMADVVEEEEINKMNARNIAMVFAPNMTQMSDPLTALMHAVQVMNLLKTLIVKALREREEASMGEAWSFSSSPASSDQLADDGFDSQKDVDVSGELTEHTSDDDNDHGIGDLSENSCDEDGIGDLNENSCDGNGIGDLSENTSDDKHDNYSDGTEDEGESTQEIEDCFLRQLEWKEEAEDVSECVSHETPLRDQLRQTSSNSHNSSDSERSVVSKENLLLEVSMSPMKQFGSFIEVEMLQC